MTRISIQMSVSEPLEDVEFDAGITKAMSASLSWDPGGHPSEDELDRIRWGGEGGANSD